MIEEGKIQNEGASDRVKLKEVFEQFSGALAKRRASFQAEEEGLQNEQQVCQEYLKLKDLLKNEQEGLKCFLEDFAGFLDGKDSVPDIGRTFIHSPNRNPATWQTVALGFVARKFMREPRAEIIDGFKDVTVGEYERRLAAFVDQNRKTLGKYELL